MKYCVYIITNKRNGTLYIGCTSNLPRRINEHREGLIEGFSKKYNLKSLVYYEIYDSPDEMIRREKQMKDYDRNWKINLIEKVNSEWADLYLQLTNEFNG